MSILQPFKHPEILSLIQKKNDFREVDIEKIDTWEREHYERNKTIRKTLDIIKNYTLTKPIADAYEGFMNNKELREIAFPFISPKHAIAALDTSIK